MLETGDKVSITPYEELECREFTLDDKWGEGWRMKENELIRELMKGEVGSYYTFSADELELVDPVIAGIDFSSSLSAFPSLKRVN